MSDNFELTSGETVVSPETLYSKNDKYSQEYRYDTLKLYYKKYTHRIAFPSAHNYFVKSRRFNEWKLKLQKDTYSINIDFIKTPLLESIKVLEKPEYKNEYKINTTVSKLTLFTNNDKLMQELINAQRKYQPNFLFWEYTIPESLSIKEYLLNNENVVLVNDSDYEYEVHADVSDRELLKEFSSWASDTKGIQYYYHRSRVTSRILIKDHKLLTFSQLFIPCKMMKILRRVNVNDLR